MPPAAASRPQAGCSACFPRCSQGLAPHHALPQGVPVDIGDWEASQYTLKCVLLGLGGVASQAGMTRPTQLAGAGGVLYCID